MIGDVMADVSHFATTIAAAVREQSTSTREINIQHAAGGTTEPVVSMPAVTEAIEETNHSASAVLEASASLSAQAGVPERSIEDLLGRVAAA